MQALISGQFPRDYLGIVGFSERAREIRPEELPAVSWDYVYGTNMQHALLARRRHARAPPRDAPDRDDHRRRADGAPLEDGEVFFNYPPVPETVEATLQEVLRCSREGIRINTFALDATGHLRNFVEKITQLNRGRAFFTTPDTLGDYVLVDFIENRRQLARRHSQGRLSSARGRPRAPRHAVACMPVEALALQVALIDVFCGHRRRPWTCVMRQKTSPCISTRQGS